MIRKALSTAILVSLLSACGSEKHTVTKLTPDVETPVTETPTQPAEPVALPAGRLAYNTPESNSVHIFDLTDNAVIETFTLTNPASALYASPAGRYVVAIQRNESLVEFIDGGIYLEEHGDHHDLHHDAPSENGFELTDIKPTHYVPVEDQALVFFDGDKEASADAGFAIISDESIESNQMIAEHHFETYMHGTGQIRGEFVLSTLRDVNSESTLPETIGLYEIHGDHFHLEQTFTDLCPGLHGSFQTEEYIAFACTDGVVKIKQENELFTSSKIANPETMPEGVRIGKFIGSHENNTVVGLSRGGVFTVNLETDVIEPFAWQSEGITNYLAYAESGDGESIVVLDEAGFINVFSQEANWQLATRFQVLTEFEENVAVKLFANKANGHIMLAYGATVYDIDLESEASNELFTSAEGIANITWLGAFAEEAHEH